MYKLPVILAFASILQTSPMGAAPLQNVGFLQLGLFYSTKTYDRKTTNSADSKVEKKYTDINATLGYSLGSGLLLGLKVISVSETQEDSEKVTEKLTGAGVSFGFYSDGLFVLLSSMSLSPPVYALDPSKVVYSGGGGVMLDLAYLINVDGWFAGPQITWQSLEYKSLKVDGTEDTRLVKQVITEIKPYVSFLFAF